MTPTLHFKTIMAALFVFVSGLSVSQPLSGTYTIGGVSPDYPSIGSAAGAVQSFGVSGPVVFNIRDGFYAEKIIMFQFAGSSATNTVTFQSENGDSSLVIISDSSSASAINNFTIQLFGADYVTFSKVTIQRPGTNTFGTVIEIGNNSNFISLEGNRIIGGTGNATATTRCLVYTDSLAQNNSIILSGNHFFNGNYGVYKQSYTLETGNSITGNIFENQYAAAIRADHQDGITISRNVVNATGSSVYSGIILSRSYNGCTLNKNRITINNGTAGIHFLNCTAFPGDENVATNNFIQVGGSVLNAGIFVNSSTQLKLYHNSVNLNGTNTSSAALRAEGTGTVGLLVKNNIFANTGGGLAVRVISGVFISSDYNDLYTTGVNVGSYNSVLAALLVDWQNLSLKDTNSVSADPVFVSSTDLHANSVAVNNMGSALPAVATDIDGEARSATSPDPGADEFTPLSDNVKVVSILSPVDYACGDSNTFVSVVVQNLGINNASGIPVTVDITGTSVLSLTGTISGPLSSYGVDTITLGASWITYAGGVYSLTCYTAMPGDQNLTDDTLLVSRTIIGIPNVPTVVSPQQVCEGAVSITALTDSGNVIYWYDSLAGGNLLFSGNPFSPVLTTDTTFYIEAHSGTGSTGCLRITEIATESATGSDHMEIQNCSASPVNVNGWFVAISESYTNINLANAIIWDLSPIGTFAPGQLAIRTDDAASPDYWGANMFWASSNPSWAILVDNTGTVVDFVPWGWTSVDIQSFNLTINGFPLTIGGSWNGDGVSDVCGSPNAMNRQGSSDHDDASDFICSGSSSGLVNPGLLLPFQSCGASACGSIRIPVSVVLNQAPTVSLGPDTISGVPVLLDAGAGFASYLWSDSTTAQTLTVNSSGIYAVTVTDANGCSATDTIQVTLTVGVNEMGSLQNIAVFPNPVQDLFSVSFYTGQAQNMSVRFINSIGETVYSDDFKTADGEGTRTFSMKGLPAGLYLVELKTSLGLWSQRILKH